VIVVDDDVDPEDWRQIEQALATRMRGERDIFVMPGLKADRCEPQQVDLTVSKVGWWRPGSPAIGRTREASRLRGCPTTSSSG